MGDEKPPAGQTSEQAAAADALRRSVEEIRSVLTQEAVRDSLAEEAAREQAAKHSPSLSSGRSEYQKLCDELGGPVEGIAPNLQRSTFERHCGKYGSNGILPLLLRYKNDVDTARRHWPYAAVAIGQYVFEIKERSSYRDDEPQPSDIEDLLRNISQSARDLSAGLCRLQTLAERLKDPTAPFRRGHLGWLDAFISQAAAGIFANEVNESPEYRHLVDQLKMAFLKRLAEIEGTATRAIERTDRALLERERGPSNPALPKFVRRCGSIWTSLTGRNPTGEKLVRKDGRSEDPDFVLFMQELARVAGAPEPKRNEVVLCLKQQGGT
jgi:hypothetical protein